MVRSGATWLSLRRAVNSIFALKRVRDGVRVSVSVRVSVRVRVRVSCSECRTVRHFLDFNTIHELTFKFYLLILPIVAL